MTSIILIVINALLFILPAYIGNSSAALFGHGKPVDGGRVWSDGKRLFGDGKTWLGLFAGVFFAFAAGTVEGFLLQNTGFEIGGIEKYAVLGFLLGAGAMVGDLAGSFLKRRLSFERGQKAPLWDQLNFVLGALVFAGLVFIPSWPELLVILIATPGIHLLINWIGHELKCKNVPW
ncbi:CDP-2,3-bis-(O-geranylgeranyl)-sn-glycerol synthase [archaeon]|nr:CDP-2,3-bis-(O-geranylgeranyl)-sn-glycerol synthase [archaeon]